MKAHADERLAGIRHRAAIADEARLRLARFSLMPSTVISTILYRPEARELEVLFTTGRRYVYRDVPAEAAEAFRSARIKGRHFNSRIRGHYPFVEQEES